MNKEQETQQETKNVSTLKGVVVSVKMQKTVVVSVDRFVKHPKYGKYIKRSKRYKAHNESGEVKEGDIVTIQETSPISKDKTYKVVNVVRADA